jgi:hypothetical protein
VVSWLSLDPRFESSNLAESGGFFKGDKICSTIFFVGEVKPLAPCRRILWCVKDPLRQRFPNCGGRCWPSGEGGGHELFGLGTFILNEIWTQDKIYIFW